MYRTGSRIPPLLGLAGLVPLGYSQTTWYVDVSGTPPGAGTPVSPYTSIQFAISQVSTVDGDTVLVLPGIYLENLDLLGKGLTVRSQDGADSTTIDGGSSGSVITLVNGETATIDGFTITKGTGTLSGTTLLGGGIFCQGSVLTVQDCRILENGTLQPSLGGGVYADGGSSLTVVDCEISTNEARFGAGIYLDASNASVQGCGISANYAGEQVSVNAQGGGGIHAGAGSNLDLNSCTVSANVVISGNGGGLLIESSSATISDCEIVFNDGGGATVGATAGWGGGVYSTQGSVVQITDSNLSDNWGDKGGGGIYGSATLTGCTIARNHGQFGGGAYAVDLAFTDCVISDNRGSISGSFDFGGGIYVNQLGGNALCLDSTIEGNSISGLGGGGYGGVYVDCVINGNSAGREPSEDGGGGIYLGTLEGCLIFDNAAESDSSFLSKGGGVDRCHLERCILWGNRADHFGAAASNSTLIHCTVFGNTAGSSGGGIYNDSGAATVLNSILWRNEPGAIALEGGSLSVTYSDVEGGWPGPGNITANPLFWNAAGADFHLLQGSPCIDAGDPLSPLDPDGSIADMGALPFDPSYCPAPVTYCTAGVSAAGCQAAIGSSGTPSASAPSGFWLLATGVEGQRNGLFYFGANGRQANPWGNGTSYRCVVPPVSRGSVLYPVGTLGACDGAFAYDLNAHWTAQPATNPGYGVLVQAQLWYRDPLSTSNQTTSLSDALEFGACP